MSNQGTKRYGVVSIEDQAALSGLEFVQGLANGALDVVFDGDKIRWS